MSTVLRVGVVLVIAVAALMFVPSSALLSAVEPGRTVSPAVVPTSAGLGAAVQPAQTTTAAAASSTQTVGQQSVERMRAALDADHIPSQEQLLPSLDPGATMQNGQLTIGSSLAPQPTGIADYGITEVHGTNVASISYTPSVEGVLNLTELKLIYLDSYGPDEFTVQLNSVAVGVTLQQSSVYQFWTQNVIYYFQSDHTLHLADAIVNFSSPEFNVPYGALLTGNGYLAAGFGYFDPFGPAIYAPEPFTIAFYSNLTVVNNHPAVYFNYSVTSSAGTSAGSYDMVEFNSTVPVATAPTYQINGEAVGDTGYIPNDVELDLGGNGGGSTTTALNASGTMNLYIQHNGSAAYYPVPAAWNFGGETGETLEGIGEWASGGPNPTVHLGPGPGVQQALWGIKGATGFGEMTYSFNIDPSSAFVFASLGSTFDPNTADWAPVPVSGLARYELPPGSYSFEILLSEYQPVTINAAGCRTYTLNLVSDPSLGIYTPLWAHTNGELAGISEPGGAGTKSNPYVLFNGPWESLNPLFGQYNDYMFPVFPGLLLAGTTDYVTVYDESPFEVPLSLASEQYYSAVLPLDNELGYALYNARHVSIVSTPSIGGWVNVNVYGGASLILWNATHDLIAGDGFQVASLGILAYGGSANTFWGNVFTESVPIAPDPGYILNYEDSVAMELYESGDIVYNNYFGTPQTAFTPPYSPYDFYYVSELWTDRWNVVIQPATDVRVVNGWSLSGNILGLSYEGGNYWSNYGTATDPYGVLPYNNGGNIVIGGDHHPLVPFALYEVTFIEKGLPSGTQWNVTLNGVEETSTGKSIHFWDPSGLYAFAVTSPSSYTPSPSIGAVEVVSSAQTVSISWS